MTKAPTQSPCRRAAALGFAAFFVAALLVWLPGSAGAQSLQSQLSQKRGQLARDRSQQTALSSALSDVQTAHLTADAAARGNAFGPYVGTVLSQAEESLDGLAGTFRSIQPPDCHDSMP